MQIVEIPRENGEYEKVDKSQIDLVTAENYVKVATLLEIHKEETVETFLTKKSYSLKK